MAAARKDFDPAAFGPGSDLLGLVDGTSHRSPFSNG